MNVGNGFGIASLVVLAMYVFGSRLPASVFTANLRGFSLLLILPLSLIAGWKGSRLWWILSAGVIALTVFFFVALGEHR